MAKNKSQYDSTLNLPKTLFEMRAGLPKKEPVMLKDWDDNDLYNQLMKHNEGKPQFILHDGGKVTLPGAGNAEAHSSGALSAMMGCNCLVEIPAGSGPSQITARTASSSWV